MHLFLDLEDTVITPVTTSWWQPGLIHIEQVVRFMQTHPIEQVHLFSFALHNRQELARFEQALLPHLQQALGCSFTLMPTVDDDIIPVCAKAHGLHPDRVDFNDLVDFWGKQNAWRTFIQHHPHVRALAAQASTPLECVLIDDLVQSEHFFFPELNLKGQCINVAHLL